jgi:hypothetical protein
MNNIALTRSLECVSLAADSRNCRASREFQGACKHSLRLTYNVYSMSVGWGEMRWLGRRCGGAVGC